MKNFLVILMTTFLLFTNTLAFATEEAATEEPSEGIFIVDALLVRPVSLASVVFGAAVFVVSLPFSALGGNVNVVAKELVADPVKFTFVRPLGEFSGYKW